MKITIGVIIGVVLGIIVVVIAMYALIFFVFNTNSGITTQTPAPSSNFVTVSPSPSRSPVVTVSAPSSNSSAGASGTNSTDSQVDFKLNITSIENTGLTSRKVTGQITNSGTSDAHNVSAKVQVLYQGVPVPINNQNYITQSFGTIKSGNTVTETMSLSFGILDAAKISQSGATIELTISSDERVQNFSYDFHP